MMTFSELVRKKREERGMSVYELARKSQVGYRIVKALDRGTQKETGVHKAIKICKALEIPSYVLMEVDGED